MEGNNAFHRLGLPEVLALDPDQLADRFRELSLRHHPDSGGREADFARLKRDHESLLSPSRRLKEALGEVDDRGALPAEIMDLFGGIAGLVTDVEAHLQGRSQARSGLGKAMFDAKAPALKHKLEQTVHQLEARQEVIVSRFTEFDARGWVEAREEMAECQRGLVFLEKWQSQLRALTGRLFEAMLS